LTNPPAHFFPPLPLARFLPMIAPTLSPFLPSSLTSPSFEPATTLAFLLDADSDSFLRFLLFCVGSASESAPDPSSSSEASRFCARSQVSRHYGKARRKEELTFDRFARSRARSAFSALRFVCAPEETRQRRSRLRGNDPEATHSNGVLDGNWMDETASV
jgi:hypothetical protein